MLGDHISDPVSFDRTAVTAWLRGQFVFYNTPLAQVVETLNRYRRGHIVIVNEALNELAVSGIFRTDDPDAALEVMTNTLPIRQTRLTDYVVLIR
jgi:transmembrane sensor